MKPLQNGREVEAQHLADCGVSLGAPIIHLNQRRAHKKKVVSKLRC